MGSKKELGRLAKNDRWISCFNKCQRINNMEIRIKTYCFSLRIFRIIK